MLREPSALAKSFVLEGPGLAHAATEFPIAMMSAALS